MISVTEATSFDGTTLLSALQAMGTETDVTHLLEKALLFMMTHTAAQKGLLLLMQDGELKVVARCDDATAVVLFQPAVLLATVTDVAHIIIQEVCYSQTDLFIEPYSELFYQDSYLAQHPSTAVLCLPVLVQQTLRGIVYLENQHDVFTAQQCWLAEVLAGQTAVALVNAQRFAAIQQEAGERQRAAEMLRVISAGTAAVTGADFFRSLVRHLAEVLHVHSAFMTECADEQRERVRTLAFLKNNAFRDNYEYELEGTTCEGVIAGSVCYYSARVQEMFPKDKGVESFLGVPIHNSAGEILGHLAINDIKPMPEQLEPAKLAIMQIFAARAGAELDRIYAHDALQRAKDELEIRVIERTAELSHSNALLQAEIVERERMEAEREKLIEELDAFAHTVAHDLKNPLAGILACAELLETDWVAEDERANAIMNIARSGRKMSNIIQELLTLAEMRQLDELQRQPLNMARLVSEAQHRLAHHILAEKAVIALPDEWPTAVGYGPWVEEVWANYLSNGLKYGGRPPQLEVGGDLQTDGYARFWVRDNGRGLAADEQARLFTPFTRLHQIHATGHGLGLSIVQRIVNRLGGQVGVESQPDRGSIFFFTLPVE